jgi:hypothetical protein
VNTWYYYATTANTTNWVHYRNGASIGTNSYSCSTPMLWDGTRVLKAGATSGGGGYAGRIDEVAVNNTVLSAGTLLAEYNCGNDGTSCVGLSTFTGRRLFQSSRSRRLEDLHPAARFFKGDIPPLVIDEPYFIAEKLNQRAAARGIY